MAPGGKNRRLEVTCRTRLLRRAGIWEEHCRRWRSGGLSQRPAGDRRWGEPGKEGEKDARGCAVGPDRPRYKLPFLPQETQITGQYIRPKSKSDSSPKPSSCETLHSLSSDSTSRLLLLRSYPVSSFSSFYSAPPSRLASLCAAKPCRESPTRNPNPKEPTNWALAGHGWQPVLLLPHHVQVRAPPRYISRLMSRLSRSGRFKALLLIWCGFSRLISLQPVRKAGADRARAHGGRIRPDLARDQRFDPHQSPPRPCVLYLL